MRSACRDLRKNGFAIVEGYVQPALVEQLQAACKDSIKKYGSSESDGLYWIAKRPGALILRHLNERLPVIELFSRDMFCRSINFLFAGRLGSPSVQLSVTHDGSAKIPEIPGAANRTFADVPHFDKWYHQLKAVFPMRDVKPENGPLTVMPGSSSIQYDVIEFYSYDLFKRTNKPIFKLDTDKELDDDDFPQTFRSRVGRKYGTKKLTAKAGDMILFDSRTIHFAGKMERGERHMLWFYF